MWKNNVILMNSLLTLMKIVLASQHKKQPNTSLSRFDTDSDLKVRALHYTNELLVRHQTCLSKTFANTPNKQKQKKLCKKAFWLWLIIFRKLRNKLHTRVKSFLTYKRKSLRVKQPARADIIHSNREIKEIFDPEKLTLSNSEHKSA